MITDKKDLKIYLHEDAKRNGIKGFVDYIVKLKILNHENAQAYQYIKTLRFCEYHLNKGKLHVPLYYISRIKLLRLGSRYHIQIPLNCAGYGLRIMHLSGGGGVILNAKKIGNYCGFNAGVLIGNVGSQENRPTIGDYVAFGPGAKAFGNLEIGNNVFVAPNAVVTKNVPNNTIVGGIPATIIKNKPQIE